MKKLNEKKNKNQNQSNTNLQEKEEVSKTNVWDSLHRKELKGKLMYKSN